MYYVLDADRELAVQASFEEANPGPGLKWFMGRAMDADERPVDLKLVPTEPPEQYPDYFELRRVAIVSQKFKEALASVGVDNVEFFPVSIGSPAKKAIGAHYAMNIVGRIACMDKTRSKFTTWEGQVARIRSLALDEIAIKGCKIFRLHENQTIPLLHEDVANAIRALQGVLLKPAEGWSDKHRF
jgi:uncharacterized protein DUF1629